MDLTTNELYKQIKKKEKNNILKNTKPIETSSLIKTRLNKIPQKKVEENSDKYFIMIILNESNISNFIYNSSRNLKIKLSFNNLEYLSLTNNYLINLNFIINLPELYYLDVFGNPLEEFEALNIKNIFGYLRLTVESFHEKKILAINGLNCSILDLDINDKAILRLFKLNNPNIMMLNNEILYYIDFLIEAEIKTKTKRMYNIDTKENSHNKSIANDIINLNTNIDIAILNSNKYQSEKNVNFRFLRDKLNQFPEQNKPDNLKLKNLVNIKITNQSLLDVKNFFDELNQIMTKIFKKAKGRIRPQYLTEEKLYLNIEKKRILLIYQTYMKLNIFNDMKKKNIDEIYVKYIERLNSNKFCDEIKIYEVKQYIKCININIRFGIIILISMLFYCLNLISMKMAITIIHYLLLKYYKYDEHKQFQYFNTFGNIHYLCYYLDNLEDFKSKLKFAEKSQIDLYQKILDILEVPKLVLSLNKLNQKRNFFIQNKYISQKNRVSTLLSDLKELKIENDIFILIEFFCDFIQYEEIEQKIINGSENDEYSTLIEIKELLEQNELEKNNLYVQDLSVKKFYKNKLESTFNKFFFENDKIKTVKNKTFKHSNENKKSINKNKLQLISFLNNWNQEYKKNDEFSTKNCLTIDKYITKRNRLSNKNNIIIRNKIKNFRLSEYQRESSNFSSGINNSSDRDNKSKIKRNIFSNKNLKDNEKNKLNQEQNLYYRTENNNINLNQKNLKSKENIRMSSTESIFNNTKKLSVEQPNIKIEKDFKFLTNSYEPKKTLKKTIDEINKSIFLKTFLFKKSLKVRKLKQIQKFEEKKDLYKHELLISKKGLNSPRININAIRLYDKTRNNKKRFKINDIFNNDLLVEKYNQTIQSRIIRKIVEKQNQLLQERIKKSRNIVPFNK